MNLICKSAILETEEENMLRHYAAQPFQLGGYTSLDDIVTSLDVDVIIEEGTYGSWVPEELLDARDYWQALSDALFPKVQGLSKYNRTKHRYWDAKTECENVTKEIERWKEIKHFGYYDAQKNQIVLFPEMVDAEAAKYSLRNIVPYNEYCDDEIKTNSFYRSVWAELMFTAFVRTVMHAYFYRYGHANAPYRPFIEEPLTEFGVLLYLKRTHSVFYHWAYEDIKEKNTCHRYGIQIMKQYRDFNKRQLIFDFFEHYRDDMSLSNAEKLLETDAATRLYTLIEDGLS